MPSRTYVSCYLIVPSSSSRLAASQDSFEHAPPTPSVKPRIDLSSLNLHSPSSIVGTPFDISPRFEYPFPPATCSPPFPSLYDFDPAIPSFPSLASSIAAIPTGVPPMPASFPFPPIATALPGRTRGETRSFSPTHPRLQHRDPPVPPSLVKKRKLNQASAFTFTPKDVPIGRPRAGSLSSLPEHLQRLAHEAERGRAGDPLQHRASGEKERSQSLDARRKRASLERHPSDVTVVDQEGGNLSVKPPLFHASSSQTLLPECAHSEDKVIEEPILSASPSPAPCSQTSFDERPDVIAAMSPSTNPYFPLPSSESSPL
ncbi:hypothetical protein BD414DRAFT_112489 [Trametes punicea]|nr:hypothetical protein BD414DRAFT_112489 [Trametes punicea]